MASKSSLRLWAGAFTGFYKPEIEVVRDLDPAARFLYAARSVILVISAQAAIIAGLLAANAGRFAWREFLGVLVGFVVAHMISNLSNDYFGFRRGHDTPDSPRMRYTIHPLASGVLDSGTLVTGLAILGAVGVAIAVAFIAERGWPAAAFAGAGIALLFLYDAAPVPLKSIGLGEIATFLVWGPLMIGGGYAMIAGEASAGAFAASIPYGLGVMSILTGKHIDQMAFELHEGHPYAAGRDRRARRQAPDRRRDRGDVSDRRGADRRRHFDPLRRGGRRRTAAGLARDRRPQPAAAGDAAAGLCRLAALASSRLPRPQPAVRLGLYSWPRGRRGLSGSFLTVGRAPSASAAAGVSDPARSAVFAGRSPQRLQNPLLRQFLPLFRLQQRLRPESLKRHAFWPQKANRRPPF